MIKLLWNTSRHQKDSFELTWGKYHEDNSKDWIYFLNKGALVKRKLYEEMITETILPSQRDWLFVLMFEDRTYLFSKNSLVLYKGL